MEQDVNAFILTAETRRGSQIALFCSSLQGPLEILCPFEHYFFVDACADLPPEFAAAVDRAGSFRALSGTRAFRAAFRSLTEAGNAREALERRGILTFESDVRPRERFLMDRRINASLRVSGDASKERGAWRFVSPAITPVEFVPDLKVCSLDIETSMSSKSLLCIGVHVTGAGCGEQRVFMRGEGSARDNPRLTFHGDEPALLADFCRWLQACDPDLLIGWNIIGFDLAFLQERARALHVDLPLGRDGRELFISEAAGRFGRTSLWGRIILDGPQLLRSSFYQCESYSLENVAQSVLGEGKLLTGSMRGFEIERLFRDDPAALAAYNLKDCCLVTGIFDKLGLIDLTVRRSLLSGMLLDQVGLSTASLDHYVLPRLHERGIVAPNIGNTGEVRAAAGGYVMSPEPGLYDNIAALDFRSLYPSIIRTFCIDPLSNMLKDVDPLITPTGHQFSRTQHLLPALIERLMEERARARAMNNTALSQAVKILMNSFYGVMGSPSSRLYHPALPDAITGTGQWIFRESKKWLEERGHKVLYGDTDSLFVKPAPEEHDSSLVGRRIAEELNSYWQDRLMREFGAESQLVLQFKKLYAKFLLPEARNGEGGAKKRYAGLVAGASGKDAIEFVGLEVVRSDWTPLAREFQTQLYERVFRGEPVDSFVRDFVARVRAGEFDDKLTYRKRLHKGPDEYGLSPPPYVRAALMLERPVREIRYVMTTKGPVPVELSTANPDYTHYIERQLRPVADGILAVLGTSFDSIIKPSQISLF